MFTIVYIVYITILHAPCNNMMMHVENICVHVCSHLTIEVFFRKFVKTLRINYKYLNNKQNMRILSKKNVSTALIVVSNITLSLLRMR
jgi:hypothetical protein